MAAVGVLGTGAMGTRIALRLLAGGHELHVWNRSPQRLEPLTKAGARAAGTPRELAARSETLITMLADPQALEAVTVGAEGFPMGVHPGLTVIEMSTVGPAAIRRLAAKLPPGVALVDAPVIGSIGEAEAGTLTLLVGGKADAIEPLLSELGTVIRTGPLGSGAAAKLVANASFFGTLAVLGEVLAFADALGFEREVSRAVLASTPLAQQTERRWPAIVSGAYPCRFALALARKDADLIQDVARHAGVATPTLDAVREWLSVAERAGHGDDDYTSMLAAIAATARQPPTAPRQRAADA